jgi:tetraacyldisaccharide 4'-kinase
MVKRRNIFLYPVSLIYGLITWIRNFLYNSGILPSVEFNFPVICVGNITVGGTGKTPHTEYIAGLLRKNFKVATLSRGYKRKTKDFRIASSASVVKEIGDEPMQLFRKFPDILVTVDKNRVHGVEKILSENPETEVIILDDAYQHRRITPGFSILLSDFERPFVNDHMLPFGNLRESSENMRRADIILITKAPPGISAIQRRVIVKEVDKAPYQNLYFTSFTYQAPLPVFDNKDPGETHLDLSEKRSFGILLVTGIANPIPLKTYLEQFSDEIIHLSFPDHYYFKEKDISNICAAYYDLKSTLKYVFTTEKDAVRLREFINIAEPLRSAFFYIPIGISFLNNDQDEFNKTIVDYVRKNKRNNRVSEI